MKLPFWATVFALTGLIILVGLGTWQVQRLQWKNEIIAQLDVAYEAAETSPALNLEALSPLTYGSVEGVFRPDKAILMGPKTLNGKVGKDLIVPLETSQGALLINMGWTEGALKTLPIHHTNQKRIKVSGLMIKPSWNSFTSANSPSNDLWFRPDIEEIANAKDINNPLPFILLAETASYKFDAVFPNNERLYPRNKHAQYALFWYALAGALCAVYFIRFIKQR